jgi:hypothetical protein
LFIVNFQKAAPDSENNRIELCIRGLKVNLIVEVLNDSWLKSLLVLFAREIAIFETLAAHRISFASTSLPVSKNATVNPR